MQQLRYAVARTGAKEIALTKLDVLSGLHPIKVAIRGTTYHVRDGKARVWDDGSRVVYKQLSGIPERDWSKVRTWDDLPKEALDYIRFIEQKLHVTVRYVSVGPERDALIIQP